MQLGINRKNFYYKLEAPQLENTEDKNLSVLVNYRMAINYECDVATKKVTRKYQMGYF